MLGVDLDDWLRGRRDWLVLWDWLDQLRRMPGTRYHAARLRDPREVERLARLPRAPRSARPAPALEDWTQDRADFADVKDLLTQVMYAVAHTDPSGAELVPRPVYPHVARRAEIEQERSEVAEMRVLGALLGRIETRQS